MFSPTNVIGLIEALDELLKDHSVQVSYDVLWYLHRLERERAEQDADDAINTRTSALTAWERNK